MLAKLVTFTTVVLRYSLSIVVFNWIQNIYLILELSNTQGTHLK